MAVNPLLERNFVPQGNIAGLLSGAGQSFGRMRESGTGALDKLRGIGIAGENVDYNTQLENLKSTPEFSKASPQEKMSMVQNLSAGTELNPQNIKAQEQLFSTLSQEQKDIGELDRLTKQLTSQKDISESEIEGRKDIANIDNKVRKLMNRENISSNEAIAKLTNRTNREIADMDNEQKLKALSLKKPKETSLSKKGVDMLTPDTISESIDKTTEYISDNEDIIFDRTLDKQSRNALDQILTEFSSTPRGQEMIARGARPEEIWNEVSKEFMTEDTFTFENILPFGDTPFQKKLIRKK